MKTRTLLNLIVVYELVSMKQPRVVLISLVLIHVTQRIVQPTVDLYTVPILYHPFGQVCLKQTVDMGGAAGDVLQNVS